MSARHRDACASKSESHASSSITMTAPHYISENKSDMRSIKPGWYAAEDDGKLSYGPFSSFEECVKRIAQPASGTVTSKLREPT
jgi:hypothetical protein